MTFDDITDDGRLWAVRYDGDEDNILYSLFDQWNDVAWLRSFSKANSKDLESYFKITNINDAIGRTIDDSEKLEAIMMDISPEANLDLIFRPLSNSRIAECLLGKRKSSTEKSCRTVVLVENIRHQTGKGCVCCYRRCYKTYCYDAGARTHRFELAKIEKVRNFLLDEKIIDDESFIEYIAET